MDYNRFFGNRRSRRRSTRLNRTGDDMVDLLQLMRRRLRYRPYVFSRFTIHSTETTNLTSFNSNPREDLSLYNNSVYREMSNLSDSIERQDVSTNTEHHCCPASVLYRNRAQTNSSSVDIPTSREKPPSTVENVEKKDTVATTNTKEVKEVKSIHSDSAKESPASSSDRIWSEEQDLKVHDSKIASTDLSSNTDEHDQSSHNSSLADVVETSEESLVSRSPPRIAYIEVHHNNDSSLSLETTHPSTSSSTDAKAGGDGHHNDSVLQFQITLTATVADIDTDNNQDNNEQQDRAVDANNEPLINVSDEEEERNNNDVSRAV